MVRIGPQGARRSERGITLTEIVVAITIIAILSGVVATGVAGFVDQGVSSSRGAFFAAVQKAVDAYVHGSIGPAADLVQAAYPIAEPGAPFPGTGAAMSFTSTAALAPGAPADETVSRGWYGADGKLLSPQPGFDTGGQPTAGHTAFVRVDLYSGSTACRSSPTAPAGSYGTGMSVRATDLFCLEYLKLPANSARSPGVPGTPGAVIRCLFVSNTDTAVVGGDGGTRLVRPLTDLGGGAFALRGGASEAEARSAVRSTKGKVLACRDADPAGASG